MHRFRGPLRAGVVALAGVATALGVASLTQAASDDDSAATTTKTSTTKTTKTTTAPKAAPKAARRAITCKARLFATRPPVSKAEEFGTLSCASPLGKGVQHDTAKVTRSGDGTKGSFSGSLKLFLNTGTLRGTYKSEFEVQSSAASYDGTIKITSGTGDFSGVTGTGTISGTSRDGLKSSLTEKLSLTLPAKTG